MEKKQLPKGWEWKKLGEITECLDSKRVPLNSKQRSSMIGAVPYYGANGKVDSINKFIFNEELLLLAEDGGSWGKDDRCAYIVEGESWVNNHAHVLRVKSIVLIKFLEAYLNLTDLTQYINGTTRGKLNQRDMNNMEVPLPPIPIQEKIVEFLERAGTLKQRRQRANDESDKVLQSVFYNMFGSASKNKNKFIIKPLGDVCEIKSGGTPSRNKKEYWENGSIPWLGSTVCKNGMVENAEEYITEEGLQNSSARWFEEHTVLIALVGATIGKTAFLNLRATTNQNIAGVFTKDKNLLDQRYLFYACQSLYPLFLALSNDSFKMANLTFIRNLNIMIPPISLQNKFVEIVERVEEIKKHQENSTTEIDNLFDALIQKAFKGELVK